MEPSVIFENEEYIIINKPAGLVVHADGRTDEPTVLDWLLKQHPELANIEGVGEPIKLSTGEVLERPGIVHRIDRDTSGVLALVKTPEAFQWLKQQFQDRIVTKKYHAFLYGELKEAKGEIDRPIGRSTQDFRRWSAQRGARGELREAVTNYVRLGVHEGFSYVEAEPKTGRTHQIRVHFKAINYPIVCDVLYAPNHAPALGFKRLALHAYELAFTDASGKQIAVSAPFPEDFVHARQVFGLS